MSGPRESTSTPDAIPELGANDPRRYQMDMSWVWSRKHNPGLHKLAIVRATVTAPDAKELASLFEEWTAYLEGPSEDGNYWHGGWFCQREKSEDGTLALLFGSAGEDVAESLDFGIQWFSGAVIARIADAEVAWQELPFTRD